MNLTLVVFDGVQALDVAGPLDVFAEANLLLPKKDHYKITLVGERPGSVVCSSGMEFKVHYDYPNFHSESDLLLVAGGPRVPEYRPEGAFLSWLNERAQHAGRFGAVCNGVFLLGHAGLLVGREITTHWDHAERLSKQFPDSTVRPDKIFVRDGNLFTVTFRCSSCLQLRIVSERQRPVSGSPWAWPQRSVSCPQSGQGADATWRKANRTSSMVCWKRAPVPLGTVRAARKPRNAGVALTGGLAWSSRSLAFNNH